MMKANSDIMVNNPVLKGRIVFFSVLCVYLANHILMLLSNGVWWDDWTVWNVTPQKLYNYLGPGDANEVFQYAYIKLITDLFPLNTQVYIFHIISFLINGISLICCWFIVKKITSDLGFTAVSSLLMASYGLDTTSMLIICSHYTFANCLFLIGLLCLVYEAYNHKGYLLYLTGIAWLCSLLVWRSAALLMPLVLLLLAFAKNEGAWQTVRGWIDSIKYIFVHYWQIIIIVMLFVPIYLLYMQPSGDHGEYYMPQIKNIITSPVTSFVSAILAIFLAIGTSIKSLADSGSLTITCIIGVCVPIVYWFSKRYITENNEEERSYNSLAGMAFLYLMVSMILPLFIYGFLEVVDISEYKSRLLTLGAFPISVIITYILYFLPKKMRNIAFSLIMVGMATYTIYTYIDYEYAWNKTEIIADYMRQHPELDGKDVYVIDDASEANENRSNLRFYAYEGIARMAYGADTKTRMESKYYEVYDKSFKSDYVMHISSYFPIKRGDKCELVLSKRLFKRKYQRLKSAMLHVEQEKCELTTERVYE